MSEDVCPLILGKTKPNLIDSHKYEQIFIYLIYCKNCAKHYICELVEKIPRQETFTLSFVFQSTGGMSLLLRIVYWSRHSYDNGVKRQPEQSTNFV